MFGNGYKRGWCISVQQSFKGFSILFVHQYHEIPCMQMLLLLLLLLLLLSRFSRVQLCATPETAAHQASPSLGFSRQEHWSGLPFPSPLRESEVAQSCLTLSDPMDCSPPGSSIHGIFQARKWSGVPLPSPYMQIVILNITKATRCDSDSADLSKMLTSNIPREFPGGPVAKNPPCNAGDVGSIPGWGTKIPRIAEWISPCPTTTQPACGSERSCMP